LLHGATTCVDFFYLHDSGNETAGGVIDAARRVGIRLVLARAMYDWEGAPRRYRGTVADPARRTRELIAAHRGDATTRVQPAPHSPHGASSAMIRAGWEVAEAEQVPFHIHVAEGRDEGERTLAEHGATPVRYLDALGVLGPRMIGVHCVWLDAECAFAMGTRAGASILDLDAGVIEPGKLADLVAVNLDDPSLHPRTDLLKAVVYAMSSRAVSDVWVHGRQVVASGRLTTVDE